jgi:predicted Rossmann-fold nucleotide-binding protein
MGEARNIAVALSSRSAIAIGGSHGTLSEICFALKHGVRVAGLQTWPGIEGVHYVESAAAAVEWALEDDVSG